MNKLGIIDIWVLYIIIELRIINNFEFYIFFMFEWILIKFLFFGF